MRPSLPRLAGLIATLTAAAGFPPTAAVAWARPPTATHPAASTRVTAIRDITGGAMTLTFDPATVAALKAVGVTIATNGAATAIAGGAAASFPITSGYAEAHADHAFTPSYLLGSVEQFGSGLVLSVGGVSVTLTDLVVDFGGSSVYATIGTTEDVPVFSLGRRGLTTKASGRTLSVGGLTATLSATGASELDTLFHTTAIAAGMPFGSVTVAATGQVTTYDQAAGTVEIPRLSGIATSITLGDSARATFARVGATPAANGSAGYDPADATFAFPITGGTAVFQPRRPATGSFQGVVLHQGSGLALTRGSTTVTITDLTVEPGASAVYASVNGGADNADLFTMVPTTAKVTMTGGNVELAGVALVLTTGAAAMLNSVFATSDFTPGAGLGTLSLVASGR